MVLGKHTKFLKKSSIHTDDGLGDSQAETLGSMEIKNNQEKEITLKTHMNTNGVSNCQNNGEERFEYFTSGRGRKAKQKVQYDYRNHTGELFSCIANSLDDARLKRDNYFQKN